MTTGESSLLYVLLRNVLVFVLLPSKLASANVYARQATAATCFFCLNHNDEGHAPELNAGPHARMAPLPPTSQRPRLRGVSQQSGHWQGLALPPEQNPMLQTD